MSKTVLVTGCTRGIGLTFVQHYQDEGWKVIAAARNLTNHADTLRQVNPYKIVQLDVTDEHSVKAAAKALQDEPIDLLINNAGVLWRETLENTKKADMMTQYEVNAVGPFLVTRALLPNLKAAATKNGTATVANLSSVLGSIAENGSGGMYGYRASKAALNMITTSLSQDLKKDGIAVLAFHPGYVATDMNQYKGVVAQADSVAGLTKLIANASIEDSGKYMDYTGKPLPW